MWPEIATLIGRNLALVLVGALTVLAIMAFNLSEWLETYYPNLAENIHYAIAAVLLFGIFYLTALLVQAVWAHGEETDG